MKGEAEPPSGSFLRKLLETTKEEDFVVVKVRKLQLRGAGLKSKLFLGPLSFDLLLIFDCFFVACCGVDGRHRSTSTVDPNSR